MFVCFDHRLFTPANTPKGVDFCVHVRLYSRLKGSHAPSSGRLELVEKIMLGAQVKFNLEAELCKLLHCFKEQVFCWFFSQSL